MTSQVRLVEMKKTVVIIGASGHGKVVADIVKNSGDKVLGYLDDNPKLNDRFAGFPILGQIKEYQKYRDASFVVAIGDAKIRERIVAELKNVIWYTAIHPTAVISAIDTAIGEKMVVMGENCMIGAVVIKDILETGVYAGVPIERKEKMKKFEDNKKNVRGALRIVSTILSGKERCAA